MRYALALFVSVLIVSGCAGISKEKSMGTPTLLEPQAVLKFSDIPVPVGFKILGESSYTFESAGLRVGLLKYQGNGNADQIVNFYKEQMPMYNWRLLNIVEYGDRLLNFERENESCILGLLPKGNSIIITVYLGPKSQPSGKAGKPLK